MLFNFPSCSQSQKVKKWYYLSEFMFQLNVSISAGIGSFVAARGWRVRCCCRSISAFLVHVEQRQRFGILECVLIMFAQSRNLKPILIKSFGSGFGQARPSPDLFWGPASKELFLHHFFAFLLKRKKRETSQSWLLGKNRQSVSLRR